MSRITCVYVVTNVGIAVVALEVVLFRRVLALVVAQDGHLWVLKVLTLVAGQRPRIFLWKFCNCSFYVMRTR